MSDEYYIKRNDTVRGPVTEAALQKLIASKKVKSTDLISTQKESGWKPVSDLIRSSKGEQPNPPEQISPVELEQVSPQKTGGSPNQIVLPAIAITTIVIVGILFVFWPDGEKAANQQVAQTDSAGDNEPANENSQRQIESDAAELQSSDTGNSPSGSETRDQNTQDYKPIPEVKLTTNGGGDTKDDTSEKNTPDKPDTKVMPKDETPAVSPQLTAFLKEHDIPARDDIVTSLQEAQKRVETAKKGHVVIGQIQLPADTSMDNVICQTEIVPGGYFIDAVQTPGIPVWFWHPECAFAEAIPKTSEQTFEWLGLTELKTDKRRGIVKGIARVDQFNVPENPKLNVTYSLPFVNTVGDTVTASQALGQKLGVASKPEAQLDADTGFFEISNLMDAMIKIEIIGDGPENFREYFQPSMDVHSDLGVVSSSSNTNRTDGPLPGIDDIELADDGKPKINQLIRSLKAEAAKAQGSGPSTRISRLSQSLNSAFEKTEKWREKNGGRSAVCVVAFVNARGVDMQNVRTSLRSAERVNLSSNYTPQTDQTDPRLFYGIVKPGSVVELVAQGFQPIRYTVKGSNDGIEFLSIPSFSVPKSRERGGVKGQVTIPPALKKEAIGIHLALSRTGYINTSGLKQPVRLPSVSVSDSGHVLSTGIPGKVSSKAYNFIRLVEGNYTLTLWAGKKSWARQIPLHLNSKQFQSFPPVEIHKKQQVEISFVYRNRIRRDSLVGAEIKHSPLVPSSKDNPVQLRSGLGGSDQDASKVLGQMQVPSGGLLWTATQKGNTVLLQPHVSPGFFTLGGFPNWKVLRLGNKPLDEYRGIEVQVGKYSTQLEESQPFLTNENVIPLRLTPGNCYLLQQDRAGYCVLIQVKEVTQN